MDREFSKAEIRADAATNLPAFPVKLKDVKRTISEILSMFGRDQIFSEYTVHDIRHVDDMLAQLEWIIPDTTKSIMSAADWLMIVLSIYFHDMGLIVTEREYSEREKSGFREFAQNILFEGSAGADYKSKIETLSSDKKERFLYQEFVRFNHAKRVKGWIEGKNIYHLGFSKSQIGEVDRLLSPLVPEFRRDLALVCESHNLDDIENTKKYPVSQPYGNSDDETANVQFCAGILRTVDLLQVTEKRAPTVLLRLIDPSDPISQHEWSKQNAVRRIRAKPEVDREGNATTTIQSQTIEIFANFKEENSFFGLTSYLKYVEDQIGSTYSILRSSQKLQPKNYYFPWRYIDSSNVGVEGFLTTPFGFEIDQEKILNLLTGHTLYNDSDVVVRELTQNAIDAVRLQCAIQNLDSAKFGKIHIKWDNSLNELTITDNGTGMTQEVIENHLLKVGSSRYQDPKFKENYPNFNPISRFGIGVLSSFMVADSVEIVTVSQEETEARKISLRSVHGKYLIKLLDKHVDLDASTLGQHGTSFKLRFRSTAKPINVLETVRKWIMFPRCNVCVEVDGASPEKIGFHSPKNALDEFLRIFKRRLYERSMVRVEEREFNGVTVAYAIEFSPHYRDWGFVAAPETMRRSGRPQIDYSPVATCVEGIAVEFDSPGFIGSTILAVANITGREAPRTNVARSLVEITAEKENAVRNIYKIFFDSIADEARRLKEKEGYSLTWSVEQIPYLLRPITILDKVNRIYKDVYQKTFSNVPMFLLERNHQRIACSLEDLHSAGEFWTVDSQLMRSVEDFVREARSEVTAGDLIVTSQGTTSAIPNGNLLANSHRADLVQQAFQREFEPVEIVGNIPDRRLDIRWRPSNGSWLTNEKISSQLYDYGLQDIISVIQENSRHRSPNQISSARSNVIIKNLDGYAAVRTDGKIYILPNTPLAKLIENPTSSNKLNQLFEQYIYMHSANYFVNISSIYDLDPSEAIERYFRSLSSPGIQRYLPPIDPLRQTFIDMQNTMNVFDPLSWSLRDHFDDDDIPF
ncbi:HD domain-containing protein [Methylobacterium sp. MA0201]|uniref:HD domain-containing protein n=1 Tax=Methylobacterium alsaeris TaxID=3344826 RepID=UPI00375764D3